MADAPYVSLAEMRAAGVPNPPSDADVTAAVALWQTFIDRACRQWFSEQALEIFFDGTDSGSVFFGVPIITITELEINLDREGNGTLLDPEDFRIYNAVRYPPDRKNPRIKLIDRFNDRRDIFTAPMDSNRRKFLKGVQNQRVKGTFGYVEDDGSVPPLIKRALTLLVIEKLANPPIPDPSSTLVPPILSSIVSEEWTDGHKLKYDVSSSTTAPRSPGFSDITSNPEILGILRLFKAPIGIATPNDQSYR